MSAAGDPTYPVEVIARLLNISPRRVQQLAKEGVIPKASRGKYALAPSVMGYVKYLQEKLDHPTGQSQISLNAERARKTKAEADIAEMNAAQLSGELISGEEMQELLLLIFAEIKTKLLNNAPSRIASRTRTMKTMGPIKAAAKEEISATLADLAETDPARLLGLDE